MRVLSIGAAAAMFLAGCAENEPGTLGQGNPGVPGTVATGAPAEAEKGSNREPAGADAVALEKQHGLFGSTNDTIQYKEQDPNKHPDPAIRQNQSREEQEEGKR